MFRVSKTFRFEAAHRLPEHDGKCVRMHGHSYRVQVVIAGNHLHRTGPQTGMLEDFDAINVLVKPIVDAWDHRVLNELDLGGAAVNPTAEALADWIRKEVVRFWENDDESWLELVRVYETETCYAEWHR
jgi:6-pyruvoyltetrahydropterin/6-carboxytetrahydropterin synthase